jgi:16S rRNA G966 N2-methylase RsmD
MPKRPTFRSMTDLDLDHWKDYDDILTDSLWLISDRDRSGAHNAGYWGNFVPQIPHQLLRRYTRAGEWVLDPFLGSGTTLLECRRLGRHGLGFDLNPDAIATARDNLARDEDHTAGTATLHVEQADATTLDLDRILAHTGPRGVQFVLLHPPYHDIIAFSDDEADLSTLVHLGDFLERYRQAARRSVDALESGRMCAVVIGDKYEQGTWIPLGFRVMQQMSELGLQLKSIIVKNYNRTAGKRTTERLWRYRALAGGFYVFKHEYIFLFRKP